MQMVAPIGPVYQAGTLSGNPLAMTAGIATLKTLMCEKPYASLDEKAATLCRGIADAAASARIPVWQNRVGSMFTTFFSEKPVADYASAKKASAARYAKFFHAMLNAGVYFAPSQFEAGFVSVAHDDSIIHKTIEAAGKAFSSGL